MTEAKYIGEAEVAMFVAGSSAAIGRLDQQLQSLQRETKVVNAALFEAIRNDRVMRRMLERAKNGERWSEANAAREFWSEVEKEKNALAAEAARPKLFQKRDHD